MASDGHIGTVAAFYDTHPISERQIIEKLCADGVDLDALTEDILQAYDQDHYGGVAASDTLARLAGIDETAHVLDVCSGMGGPARYLAQNYGCRVTGIDLTESRVAGATNLTRLVGLEDKVSFRRANALDIPYKAGTFDVVISQEAFAHIPSKARLIGECARVLKPGGRIVFSDIVERRPLDEATRGRLRDAMAMVELETLDGYRELLRDFGMDVLAADDLSESWTAILRDRLLMYRSLEAQTTARFGAEHFKKWDAAYAFFVGLYESGDLGGGRFLACRRTADAQ